MLNTNIKYTLIACYFLSLLWLTGCQTSSAPSGAADTAVEGRRSLAPQRVDIRGSIVSSRYSEGQILLEVERLSPSPDSRYERAYVLVVPTSQMIGTDGQTISLSELRQGLDVAILLRGGGQGSRIGVGVARKLWVEGGF